MTLNEFIARKPKELRLGQWFVNCYCKPVNGHWDSYLNVLYYCEDMRSAITGIEALMHYWQWQELPELENK